MTSGGGTSRASNIRTPYCGAQPPRHRHQRAALRPPGVFLALAVARRRARFLTPWIFVGTLVSVIMEVGQSFIGRHPDLVDIVTNSTGHVIGYWVIVAGVRFYGLDPVVFLGSIPATNRTPKNAVDRRVAFCLHLHLRIDRVAAFRYLRQPFEDIREVVPRRARRSADHPRPLVPSVSLAAGRPEAHPGVAGSCAHRRVDGGPARYQRSPQCLPPIYTCLWVAVACEAAQVFILSRTTDIAMIPLAALAGVVGWALIKTWFDLQKVDTQRERTGEEANWRPVVVALIGYGLVILFLACLRFSSKPIQSRRPEDPLREQLDPIQRALHRA